MPRIAGARSSDDEISDSSAVRKLKSSATNVNSPLRRSSRIKEIKELSPKLLRGRTTRAASECLSPVTKVTRRTTRASSVDTEEVASPARPKRKPAVRTLREEPEEDKETKVNTRKRAAAAKTPKSKENLDTSKGSAKGSTKVTRRTRSKDSLNSSKDSTEAERRDEQRSTKSVVNSMGIKRVLKSTDKESSVDREIRIVLERIPLDDQIRGEPLKKAEMKSTPLNEDENADVVSLDGSVSSSGIGSTVESDLGRRKQHFDITDEIREKSQQLIDKYQIPLKSEEIVEIISGPDTDAEVIVDDDDEVSSKNNKDTTTTTLTIPIHHSTLLCDKNDHDHLRDLFVNGSSPVAGTEDHSKEKTERPKTPLDDVVEVAVESDEEIFSPRKSRSGSAKKQSDSSVFETVEPTDDAPSETDPAEKPSEEVQLAREDSIHLCLDEKNTEDKIEVSPKKSPKKTPVKAAPSRKSVTFAVAPMRDSSQESDEDEVSKNLKNFFSNRTPAKTFEENNLFDETAVDETEPMECEDITSPERSLKIGREVENKQEEAQKNDSVVTEKDETLGDISRKATKDSDSESLNSSFGEDSKAEKNSQKVVDDSDDTSVKDSEKGEEIDMNRSRKSMSKEKRLSTKIDTVVEETEDSDDDTGAGKKTLNKSMEEAADLNESRKSIGKNRKSSIRLIEVVSEDSVDDMFEKAVNKSLNKSKEDRQSLSKSIQEDVQSRRSTEKESRRSTEKEPSKKRSFSRILPKETSSDDEKEVQEKNVAEEPAKESEKPEEIVLSSDKNSSEKEEDGESEEIEVGKDEIQIQINVDEEDSPAFSPVSDLSDDEQDAPARKSLNASQKNTEDTENPNPRKSLNQSQKVEIRRKSLEMEKENINTVIDTEKSVEVEGTNEELETSKKTKSVTPQKRQSLQLEVQEKNESLEKSRKSLDEIKALKEVSNSPAKDRKSLGSSVKEVSLRVELNESSKSRKSLEVAKEKTARESLEKNQSMEVDSEEEEEENEPEETPATTRKSLNGSKVEKELETSKSRQSLENKIQVYDYEEDEEESEEPKEKPAKTRKSLNESKVEKELEKSRKSLNASQKIEEENNLSKSRKSLNQSHKTEENLETSSRKSMNETSSRKSLNETSSRKSLNKSQKIEEVNEESLEKSQDESDEDDLPGATNFNDTYIEFVEAVVKNKSLTIESDDESISIDEKDLDKTSSEDEDIDDEEEDSLENQDDNAAEIDMSGVKRLKKSLESDFKSDESSKANKSMNKSMNKSVEKKDKSLNGTKEKLPAFMYSASESEGDKSVDEMDADILKEYNLDGETVIEYSDDNVVADDIRASETESSEEDEEDSDLDGFIVDEVSEEEEEEDEEEDVDVEEEDKEDGESGEEQEESLEEKQTEAEKKTEMLEKSVDKKRKSDVAKTDESAKRQSTSKNKTIFLDSDDDNEVMNYDDSCIVEESVNLGKPLIKSIVTAQFRMSTPNAGKKASRMSKSFENVSALDNTLLFTDVETSKKSKSRKSDSQKSLHQSLPLSQEESSQEQPAERVKSTLSRTISGQSTDTPVTKHLKKSKMNDTEPIIKMPDNLPTSEKKKKKSLGEAVAEVINTEVPSEKNNESLNVSHKKKKDKTLTEETETVEEIKKKSKKSKPETNEQTKQEVVEKKEKSKKKKGVEVAPPEYEAVAKKVNTVQEKEDFVDEVTGKPKKAKKRAAETETVHGKKKRNESEESEKVAKSSKIKVPDVASLKRRRDDLNNSITEIRTKKRQRTDDVKIVASSSGSTTHFEVMTITKQKSKAPKAVQSYRQRMLSRNLTQPASAFANYQLKLKAAGRNRS